MRYYLGSAAVLMLMMQFIATPARAITYTNVTTGTPLFADDFEGVTPSGVGFDDDPDTVDYDPAATIGSWTIDEETVAKIQVTDFSGTTTTSVDYPGAFQGDNYMWLNRPSGSTFNKSIGVPTSLQTTAGQLIHIEWMQYVRSFSGSGPGTFSLYETLDATGDRIVAISLNDDGTLSNGGSATWTPDTWQRWEIDYTVGDSTFDLTIDGQLESDIPNSVGGTGTSVGAFRHGSRTGTEVFIDAVLPLPEVLIDRTTGEIRLQNNTASTISGILAYSMTSEIGALDKTLWKSITENYDADGPNTADAGALIGAVDANDNWVILTNNDERTDLSEAELEGGDGGVLLNGADISLGNAWIQNLSEDVQMEFLLDDGKTVTVDVSFVGNTGAAHKRSDLNFDNAIDTNDWLIYVASLEADLSNDSPAEAYQRGDLDYDGFNNDVDLELFIDDYITENGPGSFAAMLASVPEPSTMVLLLVAGLGLLWRPLRSSSY